MKHKPKRSLQTILFTAILLLFATKTISPKTFVNHTSGDRLNYLICKIANTLDETRAPIGEIISTSTTITEPGYYILSQNIECGIIIDADDVWIDLNNYQIVDSTGTCTTITVAADHTNILIKNGSLKSTGPTTSSSSGILLEAGSSLVNVEGVEIFNFANGIYLDGTSSDPIEGCKIKNCTLDENYKGLFANYSIKSTYQNVEAKNCVTTGFDINNSNFNLFETCKALETKNNEAEKDAIGFSSTSGTGNLFKKCVVEGTTKEAGNFGYNGIGFLLQGTSSQEGEKETKIVDCIVNSTDTTMTGSCVSYGIQLEMKLKNSIFVDTPIEATNPSDLLMASWSPCGNFIATAGGVDATSGYIRIYHFDGTTLTTVAGINSSPIVDKVNSISWSPKGQYLACGTNSSGTNELFVYKFDTSAENKLTLVTSKPFTSLVRDVQWSHDEKYIVVAADGNKIEVFRFDETNVTSVASIAQNNTFWSAKFSPDDKFIAAVYAPDSDAKTLEIFAFNPLKIGNELESKVSSIEFNDEVYSVDWSPIACPNNYFLAICGNLNSSKNIEIFDYNPNTSTLTSLETKQSGTSLVGGVTWSQNGTYLFSAGSGTREIFSFDASASSGSRLTSEGNGTSTSFRSADWSPDGRYVISEDTGAKIIIDEVANVCSKNIIENNETCNCQGGLGSIGIEGSSATNLIIKNIGYENIINFNHGVFNVYRCGLLGSPTNIENISVPPYSGTRVINSQEALEAISNIMIDIITTVSSVGQCCTGVNSKIDQINPKYKIINSKLDFNTDLDSKIDEANKCCLTVDSFVDSILFTSTEILTKLPCTTITESTTINSPGLYCLANDINGYLIVDSDSVTLDMKGFSIYSTISTNTTLKIKSGHKNITIKNGSIHDAYHGILVEDGTSIINIKDLNIFDCENGLYFDGSNSSNIEACQISNCNIESCNSAVVANYLIKTVFENCQVYNCTEYGFKLYKSKFNSFDSCKALKLENNDSEKSVTCFSSTSGQGNCFNECLVEGSNKTSANFCSNVTGFLFNSTDSQEGESESKIINCIIDSLKSVEDGNAYGIHLDMVLQSTALYDVLSNPIATTDHGAQLNTIAWAPEAEHLAVAGNDSGGNFLRIYKFDGSTITTVAVKNPNSEEINEIAWSANGEYLAVATENKTGGAELFVYRFVPGYFDSDNRLSLVKAVEIGSNVNSIAWSPDGEFIAVGAAATNEIQVWRFDGVDMSNPAIGTYDTHSPVTGVSFSPDGNFLSAIYSTTVAILAIDRFDTSNVLEFKTDIVGQIGNLTSVDWSPIACSSKYLLATSGDGASSQVEILTFNGQTSLVSTVTANHGADIECSRWSSNGKYLLISGDTASDNYNTRILTFDLSANYDSRLVVYDSGNFTGGKSYSCAWSQGGKYAAFVGESTSGDDTAIYEVANIPLKCVIENNRTCNCNGGLCGIGVESPCGVNLIIKNIGYENDINFGKGIFNVFRGGINGAPSTLDNISVPPYDGLDPNSGLSAKISSVQDVVETIDSKIDIMESDCSTVESKISEIDDNLNAIGSKIEILDTIEQIDSKIDDISDDLENLESKIDALGLTESCKTVSSKVDIITDKSLTINSKIDTFSLGFITLDSKIDDVIENTSPCCATTSSNLDVLNDNIDTIDSKLDEFVYSKNTLDSKIDIIVNGFNDINDNLDIINFICETTDSKIDILDTKFDTVESKVDLYNECCDTTYSKLDVIESKIDELICGTIILESTTITEPGLYYLGKNIDGPIIIDNNSITLNLNGFSIEDLDGTGTTLKINQDNKNIELKNGSLKGGLHGILIENGASLIKIEDINIIDCTTGINLDGTSTGTIICCSVKNCLIESCNKGVVLNNSIKCNFEHCQACDCSQAGFELTDSNLNYFYECKALKTENSQADQSATSFSSQNGKSNLFYKCVATGTKKTSGDFNFNATGFLINASEFNTKIIDCIINDNQGIQDTNAYGIHLNMDLKSSPLSSSLTTKNVGINLLTASWSSNSKYVAVAGQASSANYLYVYRFDGSTLKLFNSQYINNQNINCIEWSSDSNLIAVGTDNNTSGHEVYVYSICQAALNPSDRLQLKDSLDLNANTLGLAWTPDNRQLAIGLDSSALNEIQVWNFDGVDFDSVATGTATTNQSVNDLSFSPDGAFLSAVHTSTIKVFEFSPLTEASQSGGSVVYQNALTEKTSLTSTSATTLRAVDFSPIACGSKYFIAVAGDDANSSSLEVFSYETSPNTLTSLDYIDHGAEIYDVKWSPNGTYILICGNTSGAKEIKIFSFDASASTKLIEIGTGSTLDGGNARSCDWSPSGRYVVITGETTGGDDTIIFEVANVPTKCTIKNNGIYNITGGLCGIGLEGASGENLIIKNTIYKNNINVNKGIFNVFFNGLDSTPRNSLENIVAPPYDA